jgi:copper chaperone
MKEVLLSVAGMSCGGCVHSVTQVLTALPGVAQAEVSLADASARVRFDPAMVTSAAMITAIQDAGFGADEVARRA